MVDQYPAGIPAPTAQTFTGGIDHPLLWLWDSWTCTDDSGLHLYCLALAKINCQGEAIEPPDRNNYPFHIRHFLSKDEGQSWIDLGSVLEPGAYQEGADARNVWSGSVSVLDDGRYAFGYTGVRELGDKRHFLQTICVSLSATANGPVIAAPKPISCPLRDYDEITNKGYYLGPKARLGDCNGEEGGPIMAWRDPFLFYDNNNVLRAVWAAKSTPTGAAIAQATLTLEDGEITIDELLPPMHLPDSDQYTQAEVPKIYRDDDSGDYYLLISACNRTYEGQPDSEVNQELRLYRAREPVGPWAPFSTKGSLLPDLNFMFGASIIATDFPNQTITLLGPRTENAGPDHQLKFGPTEVVKLV